MLCCVVVTLFAQETSDEGEGSDSSSNIRREEVFQNIALGMYLLFSFTVLFTFIVPVPLKMWSRVLKKHWVRIHSFLSGNNA